HQVGEQRGDGQEDVLDDPGVPTGDGRRFACGLADRASQEPGHRGTGLGTDPAGVGDLVPACVEPQPAEVDPHYRPEGCHVLGSEYELTYLGLRVIRGARHAPHPFTPSMVCGDPTTPGTKCLVRMSPREARPT